MIDFNELIDKYLAREFRPKKTGRYYPSEIGYCIRKIFYSHKMPRATEAELLRIFEAGNKIHEFITDVLKSEKTPEVKFIDCERPIEIVGKDFVIAGRTDDIIVVKLDNEEHIVEVKSTKRLREEPQKSHIAQLQLYMHATGIQKSILLYVQKDNLQSNYFELEYNKKEIEKIMKRFEKLHYFIKNNVLPEAEAKLDLDTKWLCRYCPWQTECEAAGSKEKAF